MAHALGTQPLHNALRVMRILSAITITPGHMAVDRDEDVHFARLTGRAQRAGGDLHVSHTDGAQACPASEHASTVECALDPLSVPVLSNRTVRT